MITTTAETTITTLSTSNTSFKLKNSAKLINMLISGLYSNKIQSITREIWSNAWDAHVAAGCPERPFDVSFPNSFDPSFRVRDYGGSLSHDDIENIYTVVGESTKEDSNDFNGKWGLGSKSPFAYTDNFTVTAFLNGEKRSYSAIRDGNGEPNIHLMAAEPTDEADGLEVAFPVERGDFRAFVDAAHRISHGFATKPHITNVGDFNGWPVLETVTEGEGWTLVRGKIEGHREQAYARMGCVLYPIDRDALGHLTQAQTEVLNAPFILDFKMGELEITPSREGLQYGREQPTAASILKKIENLMEVLTENILVKYESCSTYFVACAQYGADLNERTLPSIMRKLIQKHAAWQGRPLQLTIQIPNFKGMTISRLGSNALGKKALRHNTEYSPTIDCTAGTMVMLEDLTEGKKVYRAAERIKTFYHGGAKAKIHQIIWVKIWSAKLMQTDMVQLLDILDGTQIISVEDLPEPPRAAKLPRRPVAARVLMASSFTGHINLSEEDFEEGGIFVRLERMDPIRPKGMEAPHRIVKLLVDVGAIKANTNIVGAPKSMWQKFTGDAWVDLYEFAVKWLVDQNIDIAAMQARRSALEEIRGERMFGFAQQYGDLSRLDPCSAARAAIELYNSASRIIMPDVYKIQLLAAALQEETSSSAGVVADAYALQFEAAQEAMAQTYPLLTALDRTYGTISVDSITDYVIMCDEYSRSKESREPQKQRFAA